jgi:hypothetical protein
MEKFVLGITIKSLPRHYNKKADAIAKATALLEPSPDVFYETTTVRSAADEATPPSS